MTTILGKLITDKSLTFYVGAQPYTLDREASNFDAVVAELNKPLPDTATLIRLVDQAKTVRDEITAAVKGTSSVNYLTKGVINVTRSGVTFNGELIDGALANRLMDVLDAGFNLGPWVRFAENVFQNPAEYAREELYDWLAKSDLPITDDGHFIAYKVVRDDYKDIHSGKFDNSPGQIVQLQGRHQVNPDRTQHCSEGLHFCSKEYLPSFGYDSSGRRVLLLKINPADVVSIPDDYNFTKGRCWRYEVLEEIPHAEINGRTWAPVYKYDESDYDDEVDEDYYEDDDLDDNDDEVARESRIQFLLENYDVVGLRKLAAGNGLSSELAYKVYSKSQNAAWIADHE